MVWTEQMGSTQLRVELKYSSMFFEDMHTFYSYVSWTGISARWCTIVLALINVHKKRVKIVTGGPRKMYFTTGALITSYTLECQNVFFGKLQPTIAQPLLPWWLPTCSNVIPQRSGNHSHVKLILDCTLWSNP